MARTRLRQVEQIRSSFSFDDDLNMGAAAEGQPGDSVGANNTIVSFGTTSTLQVAEDLTALGLNVGDDIVVAGSMNNDGTYKIVSLSFSNPNTTVTVEGTPFLVEAAQGTAQATVDTDKNIARDLDYIRSQIKLLNQTANWYDPPAADPTENYEIITGDDRSAGYEFILSDSLTFDAGLPYTFRVYLNGQLLLPSTVSSNIVTVQNDYTEKDVTQPVGSGETGDRFSFPFDVDATDIIQLRWTKES